MGHSYSSPTIPWQDGHYKFNINMEQDTFLVKGNRVHILGLAPLKMTTGVFGNMKCSTDN